MNYIMSNLPDEIRNLLLEEAFQKYLRFVLREIISADGDVDSMHKSLFALAVTSMLAIRGEIPND